VYRSSMTSTVSGIAPSMFTDAIRDTFIISYLSASSCLGRKGLAKVGRFSIDPPLQVVIDIDEEGIYSLDCEEGNFYETGRTNSDLMTELEESIEFVWKEFVKCKKKNMSGDALEYRKWLMSRISPG